MDFGNKSYSISKTREQKIKADNKKQNTTKAHEYNGLCNLLFFTDSCNELLNFLLAII